MVQTRYFAQWLLPVSAAPIHQGFLTVDGERIVALGRIQDLPESERPDPTTYQQTLITPGLVNAHTHLELSVDSPVAPPHPNPPPPGERGLASSHSSMTDWLLAVVQSARPGDAVRLARCERGVQELIATGTTCANDISTDGASLPLLDRAGLRGIVSLEFFHPETAQVDVTAIVRRYQTLAARYAGHGRLLVGLSPHSPYNVSPAAWQSVLQACEPAVIHTHLAESQDERDWVAGQPEAQLHRLHQQVLGRAFAPQTTGLSPVGYLEQFGLLNERFIAAHGVYTEAADRRLLQERHVRLAHCPRSNLALQGETLRWADWHELAIPLALGTDGRVSTDNLDLRAEARVAMARHGWSAAEALKRLTLEGARVMGLSDQIGSLAPEQCADFVCWETGTAVLGNSPETAFMQPQTRCRQAWVNGRAIQPSVLNAR